MFICKKNKNKYVDVIEKGSDVLSDSDSEIIKKLFLDDYLINNGFDFEEIEVGKVYDDYKDFRWLVIKDKGDDFKGQYRFKGVCLHTSRNNKNFYFNCQGESIDEDSFRFISANQSRQVVIDD